MRACDAALAGAIERVGELEVRAPSEDHFAALCGIIIGQQLSVASARAIRARFDAHFGAAPDPAEVGAMSDETAKSLGLSGAKGRYLRNLAEHVAEGKLELARLETLPDDAIRAEIVAVKGLGPWSADMFLMFHLQKEDILPVGDLGIQEAMRRLYALEARPGPAAMERIAAPWRPHRTLACRYLWRFLDVRGGDFSCPTPMPPPRPMR